MSVGYITDMNGISTADGYSVKGVAQFGDDDVNGGPAEMILSGADDSNSLGGQVSWNPDSNPDGSWDSGWVPIQLVLKAGGGPNGVQFAALGSQPSDLNASNDSYGGIKAVELTAAAQAQGSFAWSDVRITFGTASNSDVDSYSSTSGPDVDATSAPDPNNVSMEQALTVQPTAANVTTVTIDANIRMTCPNGPNLNPSDLFGELLVFTNPQSA